MAHILDGAALSAVWILLALLVGGTARDGSRLYGPGPRPVAITVAVYAAWLLYEIGLIAIWGQTVGKMLMRIRVIGGDGRPPGWWRSTVRFIVFVGPSPVAPLLPLPEVIEAFAFVAWPLYLLLTIVADPNRAGLHDRQADTRVVRTSPRPS